MKHFKRWPVKLYTALLALVLLLSIIPFFIPIMTFLTFFTAADRTFSAEISYEYRIQEVTRSPMVGKTLEVVKQFGWIEQAWNFGSSNRDIGDTIYQLPDNVSVSINSNLGKKTATFQILERNVQVTLP